jgi:hypothetical protein
MSIEDLLAVIASLCLFAVAFFLGASLVTLQHEIPLWLQIWLGIDINVLILLGFAVLWIGTKPNTSK